MQPKPQHAFRKNIAMTEKHFVYLNKRAKKRCEGNLSMCIREILDEVIAKDRNEYEVAM